MTPTAVPRYTYSVVFRGSRDHYEAAVALHEVERLTALVTDFYTPDVLSRATMLPTRLGDALQSRRRPELSSRFTRQHLISSLPVAWRVPDGRKTDMRLGRFAARRSSGAALVYSYYWSGFLRAGSSASRGPRVAFVVHPVASQIKQILTEDRSRSGISEDLEPEELLSDGDIREQERDLMEADGLVAASNFTREGLDKIDASNPRPPLFVVPYGTERPARGGLIPSNSTDGTLRLLWVGQLSYRKGPHVLLEAMRRLSGRARLTIASRTVPPAWLGPIPDNVTVVAAPTTAQVQALLTTHHAFVMPSLVEGFGLAYLEALGAGMPVIATRNTGVRDLLTPHDHGIFVEPGDADDLVAAIEDLRPDGPLLAHMRNAVANLRLPTWENFRQDLRSSLVAIEEHYDTTHGET